jgi:Tfp pilus assembly protein PilE
VRIIGVQRGLTAIEILTGVVAVVVIVAVALPMWRIYQVRAQRAAAIEALLTLQVAQDRHFATHARYVDDTGLSVAPPAGLGLPRQTSNGVHEIEVRRSADQLGYVAVARTTSSGDAADDPRCAELHLDQHGRRSSRDRAGVDTTADCWKQN